MSATGQGIMPGGGGGGGVLTGRFPCADSNPMAAISMSVIFFIGFLLSSAWPKIFLYRPVDRHSVSVASVAHPSDAPSFGH
jgi:hypothetical protein